MLFRRFFILIVLTAIIVSTAAAQSSTRREMTVEESYLQEAIELMIIRETARSETREQKLIALQYIGDALERGNTNDEIRQTLDYLCREGTTSVARENGRVVNNFPDIRRQAARYLGQIGTEEAAGSLISILRYEEEPAVIQEAIKSLGDIGINNNNETIMFIVDITRKFNNLNPDNLIALAAIDAFEKIARNNGGINYPEAIRLLNSISANTVYVAGVRERARQLLAELRTYGR
ncbi:MAG: HEAT repeat domain-containing protein [Treponema sp.]|nr:HEAT repeat domain-containing protein [Treponema sp.]